MARTVPDGIVLKGTGIYVEAVASAAITPGLFVEENSSGQYALAAAGTPLPIVAREDDIQGNEITDDYATNNNVLAIIPYRGAEIYAILADGQAVVIGDELEIGSNGELTDETTNEVVAVALEAVDASDSAATPVASRRIKVRIV